MREIQDCRNMEWMNFFEKPAFKKYQEQTKVFNEKRMPGHEVDASVASHDQEYQLKDLQNQYPHQPRKTQTQANGYHPHGEIHSERNEANFEMNRNNITPVSLSDTEKVNRDPVSAKLKRRNPCWVLVLANVLIFGVATLVVALVLSLSPTEDQAPVSASVKSIPCMKARVKMKILNKKFKPDMTQSNTRAFRSIARPYHNDIDGLFLNSYLSDIYYGVQKVLLSRGSIKAESEVLFTDNGLIKDSNTVLSVIKSSSKATDYQGIPGLDIGDLIICADCITVDLERIYLSHLPDKPKYRGSKSPTPLSTTSVISFSPPTSTVSTRSTTRKVTSASNVPVKSTRLLEETTAPDVVSSASSTVSKTTEQKSTITTATTTTPRTTTTTSVPTIPSTLKMTTTSALTTTTTPRPTSPPTTPTTRQTTPRILPNIRMSSRSTSLNATGVTMTCHITKVSTWSSVIIVRSTKKETSLVVSLMPNGTAEIPQAKYKKELNVDFVISKTSITVIVIFSSIKCSDEGRYTCTLFSFESFLHSGELGITDMPTDPVITLPVGLIEGRKITEPIKCEGSVGYPEGFIAMSMKSKKSQEFITLPAKVEYHRLGCHVKATARLTGYVPNLQANGTVIKCIIQNTRLLPRGQELSSTAVLAVIRRDVCEHVSNATLRHPYSCNKFVKCVNQEPSVGNCPDDLCFDPESKECGKEALSLETTTGSLNDGLAAVDCRLLHLGGWKTLTITRKFSSGELYDIIEVTSNGTVTWYDANLESRALMDFVSSKYEAELKLWIYVLKCSDEGTYVCSATGDFDLPEAAEYLNITVKPGEPTLTVPVEIVRNTSTRNAVRCQADVGYPPGTLVLKVRKQNETEYRRINFDKINKKSARCLTTVAGEYYVTGESAGNGTEILCEVETTLTKPISASDTMFILSEDYCGSENNTSLAHPFDCRFYIQCTHGGIYVQRCSQGLCFNSTNKQCDIPEPSEDKQNNPAHPCYPNRHGEYLPHPFLCNKFIWCVNGREEIQHCRQGTLYIGDGQCTFDIADSHCYKTQRQV